jgi:hypothetical protein
MGIGLGWHRSIRSLPVAQKISDGDNLANKRVEDIIAELSDAYPKRGISQ